MTAEVKADAVLRVRKEHVGIAVRIPLTSHGKRALMLTASAAGMSMGRMLVHGDEKERPIGAVASVLRKVDEYEKADRFSLAADLIWWASIRIDRAGGPYEIESVGSVKDFVRAFRRWWFTGEGEPSPAWERAGWAIVRKMVRSALKHRPADVRRYVRELDGFLSGERTK